MNARIVTQVVKDVLMQGLLYAQVVMRVHFYRYPLLDHQNVFPLAHLYFIQISQISVKIVMNHARNVQIQERLHVLVAIMVPTYKL